MRAIGSLLDYAGVVEGDRVVLATDSSSPPAEDVLAAIEAAARARGARVRVEPVPPFEPRLEDVPPSCRFAIADADVVIDLAGRESWIHAPSARVAVHERGLRLVVVSLLRREDWESAFAREPLGRLFARARGAAARLAEGGEAHVTARNGTDLRFRVRPGSAIGMPGGASPEPMRRGRGGFGLFPPGAIGASPQAAEGTVVLDGLVGFRGVLADPVTLLVRGGFVAEVAGGREAAWLGERIAAHENGGFVAKLLAGIHPAAPLEAGLAELSRRKARLSRAEGVLLVGLGDSRAVGGEVASTWHWDGIVLPPIDWEVGGRALFRAGSVQAGPEVSPISLEPGAPHAPTLVARAGPLAVLQVDCRGPMPHAHRNAESDELWVALDGAAVAALDVDSGRRVPLEDARAVVVPRGVAHRAEGGNASAPMLVVERLGLARADGAAPGRREVAPLDVGSLFRSPTPPWSQPHRPLVAGDDFRVEGYARPEGMLRASARVETPEAWVVLRGAVEFQREGDARAVPAEAPALLSLPEGAVGRVVSTRRDTVALRILPA